MFIDEARPSIASCSVSATASADADPRDVPDHAIRLAGGHWQLWRHMVLRGAGFPVSLASGLSSEATSAAADGYVAASRDVRRCRTAALQEVFRAFEGTDPAARPSLWARRRKILRGTVADGAGSEQEDALARAIAVQRSAHATYVAAFNHAAAATEDEIRRIASDPRFREATLWQNHQSVAIVGQSLSVCGGRRHRRAMELVAMQVQRYALKNDSIGFFGPVGWASISDEPFNVDVTPGPALIDRRHVYFEGWCIDALIDRFNEDATLKRWAAPRLAAGVWTDPAHVYAPVAGIVPLTPLQRRVLDLCDGQRAAAAIADAIGDTGRGTPVAEEVFDTLDQLVRLRVIVWRMEVASQLEPERELRTRIAAIGDPTRRAECARVLDELVAARGRVARAAGNADTLAASLRDLDATFTRLTGREPSRRPGEMYAARGLVYEDCRRDCRVALGSEFLRRLGPPLSVMLDGARWVAAELAAAVRRHMRRRHAELRERHGSEAIDGHLFYTYLLKTRPEAVAALAGEVQSRVQAVWQSILRVDYTARRVTRTLDEVASRAGDTFRTSEALWTRAHYISPDLLVAAPSAEAFRRGEFHCVLGELHTTNSLLWSSLAIQHPDPGALTDAVTRDTPDRTMIFMQLQKGDWLARTTMSVHAPTAWQYQYGDLPNRTACRSAPAAKFIAVDDGRTIRMRARDGSLEFDALDLIGTLLCTQANEIIGRAVAPADRVPRITIGDLTIARERWYARPAEMPFLAERDRAARFAAIREWARDRGMPRRVFYKSPAERKPCFLDFSSPVYTELLVKVMRQLNSEDQVRIEEMLPDAAEAWLTDGEGLRYTCEFRIAASLAHSAGSH